MVAEEAREVPGRELPWNASGNECCLNTEATGRTHAIPRAIPTCVPGKVHVPCVHHVIVTVHHIIMTAERSAFSCRRGRCASRSKIGGGGARSGAQEAHLETVVGVR